MGGKILEYEAKTIKREGLEQGLERGLEQGEDRLSRLISRLMENERTEDVVRAAQDKEFRNRLYNEFLIS